ncbi:MAG: methyltransferase [Gammaproteobacteria bacterium]|nr:methyltransferase [Gammaproteobacteria bacterium]
MSELRIESGSFRDRHGRIFYIDDRVYRGLSEKALDDWRALANTRLFAHHVQHGSLIGTRELDQAPSTDRSVGEWAGMLGHDPVPFITYPYEWSFQMLKDAALLQLTLILDALDEGLMLKDASSFNVQWRGSSPVFIDITSFEKLDERSPWGGYRQFCQLFLFPLMIQAFKNIDFHVLLRGDLEGISSELAANLMSFRDYLRPGVLPHIVMQAKLQSRLATSQKDIKGDLKQAGFNKALIQSNVKRIKRLVEKLEWAPSESQWSGYIHLDHYSSAATNAKQAFVKRAVSSRHRRLVWDLGCNTGVYSRIAGEHAEYVIAMDADHLAVDRFYTQLKSEIISNITPIVNNLADSSPSLGWRNRERKTLEQRGTPDLILCLALVHHVVIGANIPLDEFIEWLSELDGDLVIEFVDKQDKMVQALLRNKDDVYTDYRRKHFEDCLARYYAIRAEETLENEARFLYYAERRR